MALVFLPALSAAGEIGISAEITSASIAFEDKDTLIVSLTWQGEPFLYQVDQFPMPTLEKLEILGSSSSVSTAADSTVEAGEITTRIFRYILKPTDFGTGVIDPLDITAKNRITEEMRELKTGRLTVEIAKPVPRPEIESDNIGLYILLAVVVVVGGVLAFVLVGRRRHRPEETPADRRYLGMLEEIKKETVADRKLFYSRLYRLLLAFLEKERGLDVSGKTGDEVIETVGGLEDDAEKASIIRWLTQAQTIKYRPDVPSAGDVENSYTAVYRFLESKLTQR